MRKLLVLVLTILLVVSPFTHFGKAQSIFLDVNNQYSEAVNYLVTKEITNGISATAFGTNQNIRRGDAAVFIARALNLDVADAKKQGFTDLNSRVENYVNAIVEENIAGGKTRTIFDPDANITRQEMAKMLSNAYDLTAKSNASFTDVSETWLPYVSALKENGITLGKSDSKFAPTESLTRGEFALFIYRAEKEPSKEPSIPSTQRERDIKEKWRSLKPTYTGPVLEKENTVTAPYHLGKVHKNELIDALNLTNFIRYLAYLPSSIKLNESFNEEAQAASVVNATNQFMTHTPIRPKGMDEALFNLGYSGASSSNIGVGYVDITSSIQMGYMSDASDGNRDRVGHRRWILSPQLQEVGFGYANDKDGRGHTAMKVIAPNMWQNPKTSYQMITWPAKTAFPTDFLGPRDPWSVSLNPDIYDAARVNQITVQLTRISDGKKWRFSHSSQTAGYFNIDTENYGQTPFTIIFQPNNVVEYLQGDYYQVEIHNVYQKNGQKTIIQYETVFFDL